MGRRKVPREQSAAAGGAILVVRFGIASVMNYAFAFALVWLLPKEDFASVSVLQNILLFAALVLNAGFPWVLARGEARDASLGGDAAVYRAGVIGNVALGLLLAVILGVLEFSGAGVLPLATTGLVVTVCVMLPLMGLTTALGGAMQGLRRFGSEGIAELLEIGVKCLVGLALVSLFTLGAEGVALGFLAGSVVGGWYLVGALHDRFPGWGPVAAYRTFRMALPMWIATSCFGLLATFDVLALGFASHLGLSVAGIALYQVAAILARTMYYIADAFIDATFPFMAAETSSGRSHDWFRGVLRCIPLLILPTQLVLLVAPEPLVDLFFPATYADAANLVRLLDIGTLGLILTAWYNKALFAQGQGGATARRMPVGAAIEVVALVVLVPSYGVVGAAIAFCVGSWSAALLLMAAYRSRHGLELPQLRGLWRHAVALAVPLPLLMLTWVVPHLAGLVLIAAALVLHLVGARLLGLITDRDVQRTRSGVRHFMDGVRRREGTVG